MRKRNIVVAILLSGLCACSLEPQYQRPGMKIPETWSELSQTDPVAIAVDWWKGFGSAELNSLMDKAITENIELRSGIHKVEQARVEAKSSGANLLPEISMSGATDNSRNRAVGEKSTSANSLRAGLNIAYEVDLFGANRMSADVAGATLQATQYDHEALKLVVMAEVAGNYFALLNLRERLDLTDQSLDNRKELLKIVSARAKAGADSDIELTAEESALASAKAARASIVEQMKNKENAIAVLLGEVPQHLYLAKGSLKGLELPEIKPDAPSRILEQRPDIRAAEAELFAANASIGVARAALFPSFSLNSGWSASVSGIGDPSASALSLVSSLAVPLFNGGKLEAGVEKATARQKELAENYRQTILVALQETEDALTAVKSAKIREEHLSTSKEKAEKTYRLIEAKYKAGAVGFKALLDARNNEISAIDNYLQAKLARYVATLNLFKALGGGWKS